jgi:uncharacterized protein YbjT (DUF2867 family)
LRGNPAVRCAHQVTRIRRVTIPKAQRSAPVVTPANFIAFGEIATYISLLVLGYIDEGHEFSLIIGASGNVGRLVASQLAAVGHRVRALNRRPDEARFPKQVEVLHGDLTLPETLESGLDGVDAVFLVWTAPPAAFAPALERIAKHARRIVFLSAPLKTPHPFFQQPNPARTLTGQMERLIEASGLQWTFLRPGMFAGNSRLWWAPQIRAGDLVRWPYLAVPAAPIRRA